MRSQFHARLRSDLAQIEKAGLAKRERVILSRQGSNVEVQLEDGGRVRALNLCANNYLGLAGDPRVIEASRVAADRWGAGTASVRFICGTQQIHKDLEAAIAGYLGFEDAILFAACFDANGGIFEPLLGEEDAIVSDTLNHASIIDGVRLSKARRYRFAAADMDDLEQKLAAARNDGARTVIIATDGVFSMDGHVAKLGEITRLADRYDALVMVDDCHASGHLGAGGRGSPALCGVEGRIDILSGTFGKTLGGATGGFVCASRDVVAMLRQRARPYLFSNSLSPASCGAALEAIAVARSGEGDALRQRLEANSAYFRGAMQEAGFTLAPGTTPIVPVMLGDPRLAQTMAARLLERGVYVIAFSYPVVPQGAARIRTQLSAQFDQAKLERVVAAFKEVRDGIADMPHQPLEPAQ